MRLGNGMGNDGIVVGNGNAEPDGMGNGRPLGNGLGNGLGTGGGVSGDPLAEPEGCGFGPGPGPGPGPGGVTFGVPSGVSEPGGAGAVAGVVGGVVGGGGAGTGVVAVGTSPLLALLPPLPPSSRLRRSVWLATIAPIATTPSSTIPTTAPVRERRGGSASWSLG